MKGSQITNTSPQITWHHRHATAKASFKPKKEFGTSQWSVILRTFYRQILSLLYGSFFFWNFRRRLARELLVYSIHNMIVHRFSSLAFFRIFGHFLNSRDLLKILPFLSPRLESFRDLVLGLNTKTIPVVLQRPFTNPESARCWLHESSVLPNGNLTEFKSWSNQAMPFPRYIVQHIIHYYTVLRIQKF